MAAAPAKPSKPAAPTTPTALQPLSPGQITKQATNTISKAYNPAYTSLNQQSKQAKAVSAKRTSDNKYYQTWMDSQMATLQSHADAAHQALLGLEANLGASQNALYGGQAGSLIAGANARTGNVSNDAQSNAFGSQLAQNQTSNEGLLNNSRLQSAQGIDTANQQIAGARSNNYGLISAAQTKQQTDLNTALTGIANSRTKLDQSKTGDIAKEIARLQGVEIQKAQAEQNYNLASQKLNVTAANTQSLIATRAGQLTVAQQNAMTKNAQFNLNVQKFNSATAKDLYQRQHGLGPYKPAAGQKGPKPLSPASQNVIYNKITGIRAHIQLLINAYHLSPVDAYHALMNGVMPQSYTYKYTQGGQTKTGHGGGLPAGVTNVGEAGLLNAAYNTRQGGGGLSPGDIRYLEKTYGLTNPGARLGANGISPGGKASPH